MTFDNLSAHQVESKYELNACFGQNSNLHSDLQKGKLATADNARDTSSLVQSGVLPNAELTDCFKINPPFKDGGTIELPGKTILGWKFPEDHSDGRDGGNDPWGQPAYEGGWFAGKKHMTPHQKLWNAEYDGLSPADKIKYNSENGAAVKYESAKQAWEFNGKIGPEPVKPYLPEHAKVDARVKADENAIEVQVRQNMTPGDRAKLDVEKAQYEKDLKSARFPGLVTVPDSMAAYNKRIATATGLNSESFREFIEVTNPYEMTLANGKAAFR